jgi:glucan 1,3-beta-glucosidase
LGDDAEKNEQEIEALIQLAKDGFVDIAAVGNEVMYRKDLSEDELLAFIERVRKEIPAHIPVGYVDAYYEFSIKPRVTAACDVILTNCYPYWEGTDFNYSLAHMKGMFHQAKGAANGKKVIITETGWPSQGESFKGAHPSAENAMKYFINSQLWSKAENIEIFYFSSFDESWKVGAEGEVGAYWGLWDKNEKLKYVK